MINVEKYQEVLDTGLTLDHYHVLMMLRNDGVLPSSKRIQGFLNLLNKKGYIEDGQLTIQAISLVESYIVTTTTCTTTAPVRDEEGRIDFKKWSKELHTKCQDRLKELTGKIQVQSKINPKDRGWPFLCNSYDLEKKIYRIIAVYKLKDLDAIEKTLISYITACCNKNQFFPLVKYYISKDGESQLVTEMESGVVEDGQVKSNQKRL